MSGTSTPNELPIIHNEAASRFEAALGDDLARVEYQRARGDLIVFTHTEVPPAFEGQGIGQRLARVALDYARDEGLTVMPLCPFIAAYIRRHDEYKPLVMPGFRL